MRNPSASPHASVASRREIQACRLVVIWIDWYAYHVARFLGLQSAPSLAGAVAGIELVGGIGVHSGLKFREELPAHLPITTLLPETDWHSAGQLSLCVKLWRQLNLLDPDTILVPGYYLLPGLAAALWARLHGRRSVLMTESTAGDHPRSWWREAAKSALLRALFDWAVAGGAAHRRYLERLGFPASRIARFYDVVDNAGLAQRAAELRLRPAADFHLPSPYFLYIGRLAPEKNVAALVRAWIAYREQGGSWPLVLVGDGPEASALRDLAEASPFASDILFQGHRGYTDLPLFYAFAGCFVLPSLREPWGLVVNEAMACGLPVLVSERCGCAEDLVAPGENGFLFQPSDEDQLTSLLRRIGSSPQPALDRMAEASRSLISSYSPQHFGQEIARLAAT